MLVRVSLVAPVSGFRFAATNAGLKADGLDLGLIVADAPAAAAAVCTRNRLRAPPVDLLAERVRAGRLQAVLVNSGNANAATGPAGVEAARSTTDAVAARLGLEPELVVPASTGVIGVPLATDRVVQALDRLVEGLAATGAEPFSRAILTTDQGPKVARRTFAYEGGEATVLVIAKGAGMIHPDMATTLAFAVTDAPCSPTDLDRTLRLATDRTFNRITVDGDTSTNDCIVAMASGVATPGAALLSHLQSAFTEAMDEVAVMIVADGEGAKHAVRVVVEEASSEADAIQVARTIATSSLVKTALHGQDPNWGRILAAAGRSGVDFVPEHATVQIGPVTVFREGWTMDARAETEAVAIMRQPRYDVKIWLRSGGASAWYWTCDLGHDYIRINADYRT